MKHALLGMMFLALGLASCRSHGPVVHDGAAVVIHSGHAHTRYCGHYRVGSRWFYVSHHRHGVDCGHKLIDGVWIIEE